MIQHIGSDAFAGTARALLVERRTNLRWDDITWRHHGLGMLQGELTEEVRIHVWDPRLVTIPSEHFRNVHDHRFTLTSYVAAGTILDVPYEVLQHRPEESTFRVWRFTEADMHAIVNAKEQGRTPNLTEYLGRVWVREIPVRCYPAGSVYRIGRRDFHTTRIESTAVTLVHRGDFDRQPARILGPHGVVGSAIVAETKDEVVLRMRVLNDADALLQKALEDNIHIDMNVGST